MLCPWTRLERIAIVSLTDAGSSAETPEGQAEGRCLDANAASSRGTLRTGRRGEIPQDRRDAPDARFSAADRETVFSVARISRGSRRAASDFVMWNSIDNGPGRNRCA